MAKICATAIYYEAFAKLTTTRNVLHSIFSSSLMTVMMQLLIFVILFSNQVDCQQITQEHQLYKFLMKNYEPSVRPVKDFHSRISIHFRLKLTQILELSEKDQSISLYYLNFSKSISFFNLSLFSFTH